MRFLFKQAICFDKKDYLRGVHELSGNSIEHPVFKKFLEIGLIVEQKPIEVPKPKAKEVPVVEEAPKKSKKQK